MVQAAEPDKTKPRPCRCSALATGRQQTARLLVFGVCLAAVCYLLSARHGSEPGRPSPPATPGLYLRSESYDGWRLTHSHCAPRGVATDCIGSIEISVHRFREQSGVAGVGPSGIVRAVLGHAPLSPVYDAHCPRFACTFEWNLPSFSALIEAGLVDRETGVISPARLWRLAAHDSERLITEVPFQWPLPRKWQMQTTHHSILTSKYRAINTVTDELIAAQRLPAPAPPPPPRPTTAAEAVAPNLIYFVHIPKTGGSFIRHTLLPLYGGVMHGSHQPRMYMHYDHGERFKRQPKATVDELALFIGHFTFGIHTDPALAHRRPYAYTASFRHPYEQYISRYRYGQSRLHELNEKQTSLLEFITTGRQDNMIQRMLTPYPPQFTHLLTDEIPSGFGSRNSVAALHAVLDTIYSEFGFVLLLTERTEDSLVLLETVLDIPVHAICDAYKNQIAAPAQSPARLPIPKFTELRESDPAAARAIEAAHTHDVRLYDHIADLFQRQIDSIPAWNERVATYRKLHASACPPKPKSNRNPNASKI